MKANIYSAAYITVSFLLASVATGCAAPGVDSAKSESFDEFVSMSCPQLKGEVAKLDKAATDNEANNTGSGLVAQGKAVSGFELPILMFRHKVEEKRIEDRRAKVNVIFKSKKC